MDDVADMGQVAPLENQATKRCNTRQEKNQAQAPELRRELPMIQPVELANGLGGALGCEYRRTPNQLLFVESDGKVSRLNLILPLISIVSEGTTVLKGTWTFDCESGALGESISGQGDIWWEQIDNTTRQIVPVNGAKIVNLGRIEFDGVNPVSLQNLIYSTEPIVRNADAGNQLTTGTVFAVLTRAGNFAKINVIKYNENMTIRWATYQLGSRYEPLGSGYTEPMDITVYSDDRYALITERAGNLLRVDLTKPDRSQATVVSSGMQAPHQIALDEEHNQAYIVEHANPGRLLRINLSNGAQSVFLNDLDWATGLVITSDRQYAYISEQTRREDGGRISRIDMNARIKTVIVKGLVNPFFLTWADRSENALFVPERDPLNRIFYIDLTKTARDSMRRRVVQLESNMPFRPSSVAVISGSQLLISADEKIEKRDLTDGQFSRSAPILMGVGHIPKTCISADGYANTSMGYFFKVRDSPFGGTLALMFNHEKARTCGAKYYQILVDGTPQTTPWCDYKWNDTKKAFERTQHPQTDSFFHVRQMGELWYHRWVGYCLNTKPFTDGVHTIMVKIFSAINQPEISEGTEWVNICIDNKWPVSSINVVLYNNEPLKMFDIAKGKSTTLQFEIEAWHPQEHLLNWHLIDFSGIYGLIPVGSDTYSNHSSPNRKWFGMIGKVPSHPRDTNSAYDATPIECAHTFILEVWDRVINGWNYIHRSSSHATIALAHP